MSDDLCGVLVGVCALSCIGLCEGACLDWNSIRAPAYDYLLDLKRAILTG